MIRPLILSAFLLTACGPGAGGTPKTPSAKAGKNVACYVGTQFVCHEHPSASEDKANAVAVACSSTSGTPSSPAACPHEGFLGRCTSNDEDGVKIERFYTGADAAYSADFCVNTAHGSWATEF
jgi:hypothetical protein